jgi:membrane fusion protein
VVSLKVRQGDHVNRGDALTEIATVRQINADTTLSDVTLETTANQTRSLEERRLAVMRTADLTKNRLSSQIQSLQLERAGLQESVALLRGRIDLAAERLRTRQKLASEGASSQEDVRSAQDDLMALQQRAVELSTQAAASHSQEETLNIDLHRVDGEVAQQLTDIDRQLDQLTLQKAQALAAGGYSVKAPIDGRIAVLQVAVGDRAEPTQPMLTILPDQSDLYAELFIPTRSIAFVQKLDDVRIMYDALPVQKFGATHGRVLSVSETTLAPQDVKNAPKLTEPVYKVVVALDRQTVSAFGRDIPLQSGMELSADIILEHRKVIEWVLEPLLTAMRREG